MQAPKNKIFATEVENDGAMSGERGRKYSIGKFGKTAHERIHGRNCAANQLQASAIQFGIYPLVDL